MLKSYCSVFFLLIVGLFLIWPGCAHKPSPQVTKEESFSPVSYPADTYTAGIENFIVLLDVSASMGASEGVSEGAFEIYTSKIGRAKLFLQKMNLTLPEYLNMNYALRTFGHHPLLTIKNTLLMTGFKTYNTNRFQNDIGSIGKTGGQSPMTIAWQHVENDIANIGGKTAVIIVSDLTVMPKSVLRAARSVKRQFGSRVCFYPVAVGRKFTPKALNELAWIGECGFPVHVEDVQTPEEMADFVRKVFLTPYPDTDGDGVIDKKDLCPNTPAKARVDARGCWVIQSVEYGFDEWKIKPAFYSTLKRVAEVFAANPELKVEIQGHTDNVGGRDYNKKLSVKRARAVKKYLIDKGIDHDRLYTTGYGFSRPIASNKTPEGRAENRRVELQPIQIQLVGK